MSFWTNLFSKKDVEDSQVAKETSISKEPVEEKHEIKTDENGWLVYPDGIKLITEDDSIPPFEIMEKLGYKSYELYDTFHNSDGRGVHDGIQSRDLNVTCYWELFSNKLVCIIRPDDRILSREEINNFIRYQKKCIKETQELPDITLDAMMNLVSGIKEQGIRKSFIEKCFNQKSENNNLSAGKFSFIFNDDFLCGCFYDGFALNTWYTLNMFVEDYYNAFKQFGGLSDGRIKFLIDKQAEYKNKIDKDILNSLPIMKMYAYNDILLINYIAIAAIYEQCDISQDLFLDSTFGNYILLSKTTNNGITTTRIRAYNNTITFYNGHSLLEQSIPTEQGTPTKPDEGLNDTVGYIYVMINPSLEGMVKIGKTTRDPKERVKELSSATGVPTPFILVFHKQFKDCHYTEKAIHQYLESNGYRISDNREFFKIPVTDAINIVQKFYDIENDKDK